MARDALILAVYPVDNFDLRRAVTDHQCCFYAIPSFVELVGAKYRVVPVSGPSCIVPFARCRIVRRVGFFVDAVNAQVTPMDGVRPTVPSGPLPVRRDQKETFATTMITAGGVKVKRLGHCGKTGEMTYHPSFGPVGEVPHVQRTEVLLLAR